MSIEAEHRNHTEGAVPDLSGMAENESQMNELEWARRHIKEPVLIERKTEIIGCGADIRKRKVRRSAGAPAGAAADPPKTGPDERGDSISRLFEYIKRLAARQNLKIDRLQQRIEELEMRVRPR